MLGAKPFAEYCPPWSPFFLWQIEEIGATGNGLEEPSQERRSLRGKQRVCLRGLSGYFRCYHGKKQATQWPQVNIEDALLGKMFPGNLPKHVLVVRTLGQLVH